MSLYHIIYSSNALALFMCAYIAVHHQPPALGPTPGPPPSRSESTGSPDLCGMAAYEAGKLAHQICDLIATVPARVWDSTLGSKSIELKRLLAKRYASQVCVFVCA